MAKFLIDSNVFLELQLGQSRAAECKAFLTAVSRGEVKAAVTDFTIDSVALVMESRGSPPADIRRFFESLKNYKGLSMHGLSLSARIAATKEMEGGRLDYDDATLVAMMKNLDIDKVVSFDRDLDGVGGIRRLDPVEAIPDEGSSEKKSPDISKLRTRLNKKIDSRDVEAAVREAGEEIGSGSNR